MKKIRSFGCGDKSKDTQNKCYTLPEYEKTDNNSLCESKTRLNQTQPDSTYKNFIFQSKSVTLIPVVSNDSEGLTDYLNKEEVDCRADKRR